MAYIRVPNAYEQFLSITQVVAMDRASPSYTLTGIYTYYSPMLLGYMANDQKIDLHSGWSFDYLYDRMTLRLAA